MTRNQYNYYNITFRTASKHATIWLCPAEPISTASSSANVILNIKWCFNFLTLEIFLEITIDNLQVIAQARHQRLCPLNQLNDWYYSTWITLTCYLFWWDVVKGPEIRSLEILIIYYYHFGETKFNYVAPFPPKRPRDGWKNRTSLAFRSAIRNSSSRGDSRTLGRLSACW